VDLTVVIPVHNEEKSLPNLHRELTRVLDPWGGAYEVILVDDGSTDASFRVLEELQARDPHLRVIKFDRNYGQHPALSAGFEQARGDVVVIMDADLQNDPADIPRFVETVKAGNLMVWGWREDRHDPLLTRKIPSYIFNKIICKTVGVNLRDINCGIKAFHKSIIHAINGFGERRSFLPVFLASISPSLAEIPVNHRPRAQGESKYDFFKSCQIIFSFLTSYSFKTFRFVGIFGLFALLGGLAVAVLYTVLFYAAGLKIPQMGILIAVVVTLGAQCFIVGMVGELLNRIYRISNHQPLFVVEKILGGDKNRSGEGKP
jgi:glycosyltransferase involved in cell wall biosynthesis